MLLLAIMSSTKGVYGGVKSQGGISATAECLKSCLAGTMTAQMVDDKFQILEDDKLLNRDEHGGVTRLQLPLKRPVGTSSIPVLPQTTKSIAAIRCSQETEYSPPLKTRAG